jgi:hypothetical protein
VISSDEPDRDWGFFIYLKTASTAEYEFSTRAKAQTQGKTSIFVVTHDRALVVHLFPAE